MVYKNHPQKAGKPHRVHGAVLAVTLEFQSSVNQNRKPNYLSITSAVIKQRIATISDSYPLWPMILKSMDLSREAAGQPDKVKWWLLERPSASADENVNIEGVC